MSLLYTCINMYDKHWWFEVPNEAQIHIFFIKHKSSQFLAKRYICLRQRRHHSSIVLLSLSESELSTCCASSTNSPQFLTPYSCFLLCLANSRYHSTDAIWEQTPKTRAPARHLQYHALIVDSVNLIHRIYCLEDVCRLCILTRISPGSSLWIRIWLSPSKYSWM